MARHKATRTAVLSAVSVRFSWMMFSLVSIRGET